MNQLNLTAQKRNQKAEGKNHKKIVSTLAITRLTSDDLGYIPTMKQQSHPHPQPVVIGYLVDAPKAAKNSLQQNTTTTTATQSGQSLINALGSQSPSQVL